VSEKLLRIDPRGRQTGSHVFGGGVISPVYARGSVWLINQGQIQQIDPSTVQPVDTLTVTDGQATSLAAGDGTLWALGSTGALTRFSPDGKATALQLLGKRPAGAWLSDVAAGAATWVAVSEKG